MPKPSTYDDLQILYKKKPNKLYHVRVYITKIFVLNEGAVVIEGGLLSKSRWLVFFRSRNELKLFT